MAKSKSMSCVERFSEFRKHIPGNVTVIAVSKTRPASDIQALYDGTGHRIFGENKAQELQSKSRELPADIEWHFIGHLQSNKIRLILPHVAMIHSVDSFRLLKEIDKEAAKTGRVVPCLLQFYIAREETKFGFSMQEVIEMLSSAEFSRLKNITLSGVMGMATFTEDTNQVRSEFRDLVSRFHTLKTDYFRDQASFKEISMGMTDDYTIAVEEGSTMIRIGSAIFGSRTNG
jgi:PLP dependent protein